MNHQALLKLVEGFEPISKSTKIEISKLNNQGYNNQIFLIKTDQNRYILRLFGDDDIDRSKEINIQNLASQNQIAPKVLHYDLQKRFSILEYIDSVQINQISLEQLGILADKLHKLHDIKTDLEPIKIDLIQNQMPYFSKEFVLCHNDLNPQNILWQDNTPMLIDWEYSGVNDRYFDLASVIVEFGLSGEKMRQFLENYFDGGQYNKTKLDSFIKYYKQVCRAWWDKRTT